MVVQHNMQAMNANRMLNVTTSTQAKSTEKLSSGYKINRAADDAAGLTISEKMRKQIKGLDRASTNAEDGVSSVQTAEGALTEVHSMLQRMNELAVQASNGTNSESDRSAIQDEVNQLTTEIDRVSETTKFNETYLLKGQDGTKTINMKAHDAGLKGTLTDNGDGTATFKMDDLNVGDKVSIGGKNYTIGATKDDTDKLIDDVTADTSHKDITINGKTYKYLAAKGAGDDSNDDNYAAGYYEDGVGKIGGAKNAAALKTLATAGSTVSAAGKEMTSLTDADKTAGVKSNDATVITAKNAYVLAVLPQVAKHLLWRCDASYEQIFDIYREQAEILYHAGADLMAVETMMSSDETSIALDAISSVCDLPVLCTFSVYADGKCFFDGNIFDAAAILQEMGAAAVGLNCSNGPDQMESIIRYLAKNCSIPVIAKPNAGMPRIDDKGVAVYDLGPEAFTAHMKSLTDAGARIVGGCCGTEPEHIRLLKKMITEL